MIDDTSKEADVMMMLEHFFPMNDDVPQDVADSSVNIEPEETDAADKGPFIRIQKYHSKELIIGSMTERVKRRSREVLSNSCFVSKI